MVISCHALWSDFTSYISSFSMCCFAVFLKCCWNLEPTQILRAESFVHYWLVWMKIVMFWFLGWKSLWCFIIIWECTAKDLLWGLRRRKTEKLDKAGSSSDHIW